MIETSTAIRIMDEIDEACEGEPNKILDTLVSMTASFIAGLVRDETTLTTKLEIADKLAMGVRNCLVAADVEERERQAQTEAEAKAPVSGDASE